MSLGLISNPWLEETGAKIRNKPVLWEGYQRANLVTAEEVALFKAIDRQPKAKVESVLITSGQTYATMYMTLLEKLNRVDTRQYILVMIGEALSGHEERIPLFTSISQPDTELPYGPLIKFLGDADEFTQLKSLQILTLFLQAEKQKLPSKLLDPFVSAITSLLSQPFGVTGPSNRTDVAVQCLAALLPRKQVREQTWELNAVMSALVEILRKAQGTPQMNYQVAFCLWLLSFDKETAQAINKRYDIIPVLSNVAKNAVKEKVIRVAIATLRNLAQKAPAENLPPMLLPVAGVLPFVKSLLTRKWSDEEIPEDLEYLKAELTKSSESLSTYDAYTTELDSGHLTWSAIHESESFWKENAAKLNDKNYAQLRTLLQLLKSSEESPILAVAANDLGQYLKYSDRGKKAVDELQGKTRMMELMSHSDPDVRYRALITVQRLVGGSWAK